MTPALKLAADPDSMSTLKILHAAKQAGVEVTISGRGGVSSGGQSVPELDIGALGTVRGTNPVLKRLAQTTRSDVLGRTFAEESQVDTWLEWASLEVDYVAASGQDMARLHGILDAHLKQKTFVVGQRLSLADISLCISFKDALAKAGADNLRTKYPAFIRWMFTIQHALGVADAAPTAPKKAASPKQKAAASPKAKAASPKQKAAPSPKTAAPAAGGDDAIKAVGDELRNLKDRLKGEGVTGKKLNDHPEVKALVDKLSALKAGGSGKAAAPAPKAAATSTTAPAAGGEDAIKAVGDELRLLKERLKSEGVTGKKLNDHAEVKALVDKLTALKAGGAAAPASAAPKAASPKASPKAAPAAPAAAEGGDKSDKKK